MGGAKDGRLLRRTGIRRFQPLLLGSTRLLILLLLLFPTTARAQSGSRVTLSAKAGFDGYCKEGRWFPVHAALENNGPEIKGRLEVKLPGFNNRPVTYAREISLPSVSRKEVFLYVYPEGYLSQVTVRLTSEGVELAEAELPLACAGEGDRIYALLTENLASLNLLADLDPANGKAFSAQLGPADLPDRSQALAALDALIIAGVDTSQLSPARLQALSEWVAAGGVLVVAGGTDWQKTVAGLGGLVPFQPSGVQTLDSPDASSSQPGTFANPADLPTGTLITTGQPVAGAEVLASQGEIPLAVRNTFGRGEVIFLAFDPTVQTVQAWSGLAGFFRSILVEPPQASSQNYSFLDWAQAGEAASLLAGLRLPSAGWLVAFLGVYVAAVGPLNFWLLRRSKRRELAWVTIPLLVMLFSGLTFVVGRGLRGDRPVLNRLAVVQAWPGTSQAQVDGLIGIYSPSRAAYRLVVSPPFLAHAIPPGSMPSPGNLLTFLQTETGSTEVPDLRTDIGEVRSLALEGSIPSPGFSSDLTLHVGPDGTNLQGLLTLPIETELQDAVLMAPGKSQRLGAVEAGETREIDFSLDLNTPAVASPSSSPKPVPGNGNQTVFDLLGSQDYFSDPEIRQRYLLLSAFFGQGQETGNRRAPFTLAGWSEISPLAASLAGEPVTRDRTLYLFALDPKVAIDPGKITLPPGLFHWTVLEPGTFGGASPYNSIVPPEGFSLSYYPAVQLTYKSVAGLTLRLKGFGAAGKSGINVSLWDFIAGSWALFPDLDWGDTPVVSPGRFVGPGGEVRLRLDSSSQISPVQIESADFILEVEG